MHFSYKLITKEKWTIGLGCKRVCLYLSKRFSVKSMDGIADGLLEGLCTKWIMG